MIETEVAIVGGGMAAASAARTLADAGVRLVVVDKARGPGGRCSTRRGDRAAFDHGAQYFTARDERFVAALKGEPLKSFCAPWNGPVGAWDGAGLSPTVPQLRWVGVPRMSALVGAVLGDLPTLFGTQVANLSRGQQGWHLLDPDGRAVVAADTVVLTAPPPQSSALLSDLSPTLTGICERVRMAPCWAVMAAFGSRVQCGYDGVFVNRGPLSWCARNSSKPGRADPEAWVLHAGPGWSDAHIDHAPEAVGDALLRHFSEVIGHSLPPMIELQAHRWRFALAREPLDVGCGWDPQPRLGLAGDWLAGSRIEGAWLSGRLVAERVLAAEIR